MSQQDELRDVDELRAAFRARPAGSAPPEDCPPAAELWSAVRGELASGERRAVVDHTISCAACAEAWRLAMEVTPDPIPVAAPAPRSALTGLPWPRILVPLASAAALLLALAGGFWLVWAPVPVGPPEFRGEAPVIRSLLSDDQALSRESFRLRWSPGPEGSRYDVRVTSESLQVVASGRRLAEPAFVVPETALLSLPAGSRLLWRVEAELPDGERVASPTFVTRLE